jgi:hypothetical protein
MTGVDLPAIRQELRCQFFMANHREIPQAILAIAFETIIPKQTKAEWKNMTP